MSEPCEFLICGFCDDWRAGCACPCPKRIKCGLADCREHEHLVKRGLVDSTLLSFLSLASSDVLHNNLSQLDDVAFDALGAAWLDENRKRNPLATEDDVLNANIEAFYKLCDCVSSCDCVDDICDNCCPGCSADKQCEKCHGSGLLNDPACKTCKGLTTFYIPDTAKKQEGFLDETGSWKAGSANWRELHDKCSEKEQQLLADIRVVMFQPSNKMDYIPKNVFSYFAKVIEKLGGRLAEHPIYENWGGGDTVVTYLPKLPAELVAGKEP